MRFHSYDGKFSVAHRYNIAIHCTCYCKEDSGGDKSTYISPSKRLDLCSYTCMIAKMYIYAAHSQIEIVNKVYIHKAFCLIFTFNIFSMYVQHLMLCYCLVSTRLVQTYKVPGHHHFYLFTPIYSI